MPRRQMQCGDGFFKDLVKLSKKIGNSAVGKLVAKEILLPVVKKQIKKRTGGCIKLAGAGRKLQTQGTRKRLTSVIKGRGVVGAGGGRKKRVVKKKRAVRKKK